MLLLKLTFVMPLVWLEPPNSLGIEPLSSEASCSMVGAGSGNGAFDLSIARSSAAAKELLSM
jgi:hypothetical protein